MDEIDLAQLFSAEEAEAEKLVAEWCRIDLANLDIALSRHAGIFAYAVAAFEFAKVKEAQAKWSLETVKADVFNGLKQIDPKVALGAADRDIARSTLTKAAMDVYFKAMTHTGRLKALVDGFNHRRDMLVQISARQRQEMQS